MLDVPIRTSNRQGSDLTTLEHPGTANPGGRLGRRHHVAFVTHVAQLSGAEIAMLRLVEAAADEIHATVLVAEDGPLVDGLRDAGADVEVHPLPAVARDLRRGELTAGARQLAAARTTAGYARHLRDRLVALDPDVVHTNSMKAGFYGSWAGRRAGKPVVWHLHDRVMPDYLPRRVVPAVRWATTHAPDALVAPSQITLDTVGRIPRGLRATVVPNVIPAPETPVPMRPDVRAVGIVGRLTPWKGQHVFLEAFARAFPEGDVRAAIIGSAVFGETDYEQELHEQAARLGIADRVEFRGFCTDVGAQLETLDVLVHASVLADPLTTVVLEGMAAGLPTVSANAGGHAAHVTHGHDGLLFAPGDPGALARELRRLAGDPDLRRSMGAAARHTAQRFAPEAVTAEMVAVYDELVTA